MRAHAVRTVGLAVLFASGLSASAQTGVAASQSAFEVASIKPNKNPPSGARAISLSAALNHGRLVFEALTLKDLIQQAYDLQRDRISGCPAWCDSDRFDLNAKTEDSSVTKEQVMPMLQALLADRFQLVLHRETKDRPGFALVVGKGGASLKPSGDGESLGFSTAGNTLVFRAMPITGLVSYVAGTAKQPVLDMTGLKGSFDFIIDLTPSENAPTGPDGKPDQLDRFTRLREALEDQLGLRLEPQKIAVEDLVIERAEHPSAN